MSFKTRILCYFVFVCIRILSVTYRFIYINKEVKDKVLVEFPPPHYIYALWHQNLISAIFSEIGQPHAVIVSSSKDGQLVATTCELLGNKTARGSSTRGGVEAMKSMLRLLKGGTPGAITVDGPNGPAHTVKMGIFELAKLTSLAVLPLSAYPEKFWTIKKSWDQFRIPKPFSKIFIRYGVPIKIERNADSNNLDQYCSVLKSQLEKDEKIIIDLIRHGH